MDHISKGTSRQPLQYRMCTLSHFNGMRNLTPFLAFCDYKEKVIKLWHFREFQFWRKFVCLLSNNSQL